MRDVETVAKPQRAAMKAVSDYNRENDWSDSGGLLTRA